ncbi:MAG: MarR family winged helix-turn-helix transcriptional regulator [Burkholderiaceae bacterium]|nr:MarR family winged helix-turn-helix transcriptional regulator [Burkholderiaceae bacterium]
MSVASVNDTEVGEAAHTGILFGPLPGMLGYQIRQAQTAVFRDFATSVSGLEISPGEFSLLTLIDVNPGASQTQLTAVYKVDKSTLSLRISGLVKRGLVRRSRSKTDRRYYALWLAAPGRRLLGKVRQQVDRQERAMAAALGPDEREAMLGMLERIVRVFES